MLGKGEDDDEDELREACEKMSPDSAGMHPIHHAAKHDRLVRSGS